MLVTLSFRAGHWCGGGTGGCDCESFVFDFSSALIRGRAGGGESGGDSGDKIGSTGTSEEGSIPDKLRWHSPAEGESWGVYKDKGRKKGILLPFDKVVLLPTLLSFCSGVGCDAGIVANNCCFLGYDLEVVGVDIEGEGTPFLRWPLGRRDGWLEGGWGLSTEDITVTDGLTTGVDSGKEASMLKDCWWWGEGNSYRATKGRGGRFLSLVP